MIDPTMTLSDYILTSILQLLKKEVSEHGRHLTQYFHLFLSYSALGIIDVSIAPILYTSRTVTKEIYISDLNIILINCYIYRRICIKYDYLF